MSLNTPPVRAVKVLDPRLELNHERDYVVLKGAHVNSWQAFPATNKNDSSVQITCNPPNRKIAISRLVLKKFDFTITVNGTNTSGGPLLVDGYFAPRAYPISAVTSSEQMTINNDTITQAPVQQYWGALLRYHNKFEASRFAQLSLTPSMLDQFQLYTDGQQSVRNPLAAYGDNSMENTRGGYVGMKVMTNPAAGTQAIIKLSVYEPIFISPFVFGCESNFTSALVGIQNMAYTCTLGNLARVLSLTQDQGTITPLSPVATINITNVSATLDSASLLFNYLTPDPINPLPSSLVSSYFSIVSYPTKYSVAAVPPNIVVKIPMLSVQVTSIPRRIYIFARDDDVDLTPFTSDCFMSLDTESNPLQLTWNNNQFLSQASAADLYNISVKNGCNMSFSQFTKYCGSVVCLDFGTDIGLMSDEAPGTIGNYQLSLTGNFRNTRSTTINNATLYCVVVYEGTFNIKDGNCSHEIGVLSRSDVLNSQRSSAVSYKLSETIYGGDFFKSLKKFFTKAHDFIKDNKLVSKLASQSSIPQIKALGEVANKLGYGMSGGKRKKHKRGRGMSGGSLKKNITKEELKKRLTIGNGNIEEIYDESSSESESESESDGNSE